MSETDAVMIPESMPLFGPVELAAAGFLARYSGRTRDAYALDLRTYFAWCFRRALGVSPQAWRSVFERAMRLSDGQIRFIGLTSMIVGLVLLMVFA